MRLLTRHLCDTIPPLYSQEHAESPMVYAKFFTPDSNWTWFVTEGSEQKDDFVCFGYVIGFEEEWGFFRISELEAARGPLGLAIERDLHFRPAPFPQVIEQYRRERGG